MEDKKFLNLLEEISSADLGLVGYNKLASWMNKLYYINPEDKKLVTQKQKCLKMIVQEITKRGPEKIDLSKWANKNPQGLEDFLTLIPADLHKSLVLNLEKMECENKSLLKEIFEKTNLRRMMNFNSDCPRL